MRGEGSDFSFRGEIGFCHGALVRRWLVGFAEILRFHLALLSAHDCKPSVLPIAFRHQRPGFALGLVAAQAAVNSVAFHFAFQLRSFGTWACYRRQRSTFPDSIKVRNGTRRRRAEPDAPRLVCVPVPFLFPPRSYGRHISPSLSTNCRLLSSSTLMLWSCLRP